MEENQLVTPISNNPVNNQAPEPPFSSSPRNRKIPLIAAGTLIFIVALVFAYQKGLISKRFSSQTTSSTIKQANLQSVPKKIAYACPSQASFCQTENSSIQTGQLASKLTSGTPVYAAFAGKIENFTDTNPDFIIIILRDSQRGLQASYQIGKDSQLTNKAQVAAGEQIATIGNQLIPKTDYSLAFRVFIAKTDAKDMIAHDMPSLTSSDFIINSSKNE